MISLIIPVFNEEENIPTLILQLKSVFKKRSSPYEFIFINDGSCDTSPRLLDAFSKKDKHIKVIHFKRNFGQTASLMAGFDHARGDIIATLDADLQNDPADIPKLVDKLNEGFDVVSGWRRNRKDPFFTKILPSRAANFIISTLSGVPLHDYGCTLKAYKKDVVKDVKLYGEMHRLIPYYASLQGAKVAEIPVRHHPRLYGRSKYGLERIFKVILDVIVAKFLLDYIQKPIYIFGGFALINFLFSFLSLVLMFYFKYYGSKTFVETPLPSLIVLFLLIGFQSILIGIVAELTIRTYYELGHKTTYIIKSTKNMK